MGWHFTDKLCKARWGNIYWGHSQMKGDSLKTTARSYMCAEMRYVCFKDTRILCIHMTSLFFYVLEVSALKWVDGDMTLMEEGCTLVKK